jgi:hypothetical protein
MTIYGLINIWFNNYIWFNKVLAGTFFWFLSHLLPAGTLNIGSHFEFINRVNHKTTSIRQDIFMFFKKIVFKKVLKSFRRVLKSKNSLKS